MLSFEVNKDVYILPASSVVNGLSGEDVVMNTQQDCECDHHERCNSHAEGDEVMRLQRQVDETNQQLNYEVQKVRATTR